ncbi:MAG: aminotransferase class I/II-fold pyridoxal phosphate-dependent enzyme [Alphaproteobacteria bacterium]|jgi:aspartate/methionine/tyrosine aminotransferase|nr:aminotransferase class I/II-fold pyridoxal phosphate-dependent enzyme [Alphaproteobacteria bacterium]MBT7942146.1 aminotransferase class I/II-fold pyridoxal phosphate-dependent enzyme [Alphaproteobacteria bacterium]
MDFTTKTTDELSQMADEFQQAYDGLRGRNLSIDMTRGKPSAEQLDLSNALLGLVSEDDCHGEDGTDYRNYGILDGIPEAKRLFAEYMEVSAEEIIVGENGSLPMMYDTLAAGVLFGMPGGDLPWKDQGVIKFLCPVPGYDRHFTICERLGIEMITVDLGIEGPDMDAVEAAVADDASVKGIWCVPKYSNPTGVTYSDEVVDRLAAMPVAADDFRVIWDNAYAAHHLGGGPATVKNLLQACKDVGNPDRVLMFGSTSKMTMAGSGIAMMAASTTNIKDALSKQFAATIGPDKINQLRHVRFFGDMDGLRAHMDKQAAIIGPKFDAVDEILERRLAGKGIATWTKPEGGYFVSVDVLDGCAAEVIRLSLEAGVKLVPPGSTFPYGDDPGDRNIRLAPTMPMVDDIRSAMEIFCTCVELAAARKLNPAQ